MLHYDSVHYLTAKRRQHTTRLLPPALEAKLFSGGLAAVEHTLPVPSAGGGTRLISLVCVRGSEGDIRAYENYCPHQAGKLMLAPDGYLTCRLHGARFNTADGRCVSGPCEGERLSRLSISTESDEVHTTLSSLITLRDGGSGGRAPSKSWTPNASLQRLIDAFEEAGIR